MAETTLDILLRVRNDTSAALARVQADLQKFRDQVDRSTSGTQQAQQSLSEFFKTMGEGRQQIDGAISGVRGLVSAMAGLLFINQLRSLADVAARAQVLGTVLNEIGRASGFTTAEIEKFDKAVQKAGITTTASRQALTQFLQAGLDPAKAAELARAAQNFAVITGENSSAALQRLVTNIQQVDTVGLRYQGVVVDMAKVTADFAREIGKTPAELSRTEVQTALLNEVLRRGRDAGQLYTAAMGDVGKAVGSLARQEETLAETLGNILLPAYKAIVDEYTVFLRQANIVAETLDANGESASRLGQVVGALARNLRELALIAVQYIDVLKVIGSTLLLFTGLRVAGLVFGFIAKEIAVLIGWVVRLGAAMVTLRATITSVQALVAAGGLVGAAGVAASTGLLGIALAIGVAVGNIANRFEVVRNVAGIAVAGIALAWAKVTGSTEEALRAQQLYDDALSRSAGEDDKAESRARLSAVIREQIALQETLIDLENDLVAANKTGTAEQQAIAKKAFDEAKARNAELAQIRQDIVDQGDVTSATQNLVNEAERQAAAARKIEIALQKLYDQAITARSSLDIPSTLGSELRAEVLSARFGKAAGEFKAIVAAVQADQQAFAANVDRFNQDLIRQGVAPADAIRQATERAREAVRFSVNDLRAAVQSIADAAKSPDEIANAINLVSQASQLAKFNVDELKTTLQFRLELEAVQQLEQQMRGYTGTIQAGRDALALLRTITDDQARSNLALSRAFLEVGTATFTAFTTLSTTGRDTIGSLVSQFGGLRNTVAETSRIVDQQTRQQLASASGTFQESLRLLEDAERRKKALAQQSLNGDAANAASLRGIDRQTAAERVKISETYYARLKELRDLALQQFTSYSQTVKQLDEEIFQNGINKTNALRELRRQGLSEEEQFADRLREIAELKAAEDEARQKKQFDLAKQLNTQRIQAAQALGSAGGVEKEVALAQATEATNNAYNDRETLLKNIRKETDTAAQTQLATYKELTTEITKVADSLSKIANQQVTAVKLALGDGESAKVLDELQREFDRRPLRVAIQGFLQNASGAQSVPRFASGGGVEGSGSDTSDNIPAWLSPGEWVSRAKAVRYYGVDLFRRLNDMTLPRGALRFAQGGLVPAGGLAGTSSGSSTSFGDQTGQTKRDMIDVTVNIGGKRSTLMGEREQVRQLVDSLRTLEGG